MPLNLLFLLHRSFYTKFFRCRRDRGKRINKQVSSISSHRFLSKLLQVAIQWEFSHVYPGYDVHVLDNWSSGSWARLEEGFDRISLSQSWFFDYITTVNINHVTCIKKVEKNLSIKCQKEVIERTFIVH